MGSAGSVGAAPRQTPRLVWAILSFILLLSAFQNAGADTAGLWLKYAVSSCLQSPVPELKRTKARVFSAAFNYG